MSESIDGMLCPISSGILCLHQVFYAAVEENWVSEIHVSRGAKWNMGFCCIYGGGLLNSEVVRRQND